MNSTHYIMPPTDGSAVEESNARLLYISCAQFSQEWNSTLHTHSCAELFFVTGGRGRFQLQEESFPVSVGDLLVVNATVPHTELSQAGTPMEYTVLGVDGLEILADTEGFAKLHLDSGWEEIMWCLRLITQEARGGQAGYQTVCNHLLHVILLRLLRRDGLSLASDTPERKISKECSLVRRYIDNHFKENLTLDQLADVAHMNKYYLVHAFRREYNVSPISYLIARRTQESRFLLSNTDHTLSQIAQILGFSSPSYFSQSFRRMEGISPLEYRKSFRRVGEREKSDK